MVKQLERAFSSFLEKSERGRGSRKGGEREGGCYNLSKAPSPRFFEKLSMSVWWDAEIPKEMDP